MKVIAKGGTKVPKEGKPREYIQGAEPVEVPETSYYRRLVADGSLAAPPAARLPRSARNDKKEGGTE